MKQLLWMICIPFGIAGLIMGLKGFPAIGGHIVSPSPITTFVASTPCTEGTRPVPGIPRQGGCELIKWKLQITGYTGRQPSGNYVLDCDYGMPKQGTRGFVNGGHHLHREGKWILTRGIPNRPAATIYTLDPDQPQASLSFLQLNENLLHLLDSHQQLMIGTGAWSYTLNRVQP